MNNVDSRRIQNLKSQPDNKGPIVYWMSRDQRVFDNWALLYSQELSYKLKRPLVVIFCLDTNYKNATLRQFDFMLKGLQYVETELKDLNIPFVFINQSPEIAVSLFCNKNNVSTLVTDFSPLKIKNNWLLKILPNVNCSVVEVDAHNIVPCKFVSQKCEFGAYTLRPKINKVLDQFLTEYPIVTAQSLSLLQDFKIQVPFDGFLGDGKSHINWDLIFKTLKTDTSVKPVNWVLPNTQNALQILDEFINNKLKDYDQLRNNPNYKNQSNLSPYLHFGQLSSQTIAFKVSKIKQSEESKKAFLEELIIRKELSDNYCFYNKDYDNFNGFHDWAKKSLIQSSFDIREYIYTKDQLENYLTHDKLWNACQKEMVITGKMHGYMRMYWAKKILEWTESVQQAQEIAIYLNDKYELDGRDPNGYTGIAWSIGGVHDRAWFVRPVYGKIRYMSYNGCKSKFDVEKYISDINLIKI